MTPHPGNVAPARHRAPPTEHERGCLTRPPGRRSRISARCRREPRPSPNPERHHQRVFLARSATRCRRPPNSLSTAGAGRIAVSAPPAALQPARRCWPGGPGRRSPRCVPPVWSTVPPRPAPSAAPSHLAGFVQPDAGTRWRLLLRFVDETGPIHKEPHFGVRPSRELLRFITGIYVGWIGYWDPSPSPLQTDEPAWPSTISFLASASSPCRSLPASRRSRLGSEATHSPTQARIAARQVARPQRRRK